MACTGTPCARCWPTRSRRGTGTESAQEAQIGALHWCHRPDPGSGVPGSSATRPSASSSGSGTSTGFDGQYTIVKDYVREHRHRTKEMFVPLSHPPGHAQCDFSEALVVIGGVQRRPTASSWTCPTATTASSRPTRRRPPSLPGRTCLSIRLPKPKPKWDVHFEVLKTTERTPRLVISPLIANRGGTDSAVLRYVHFTLALV